MSEVKKILLVDDDEDMLEVNATVLESRGYKVFKAMSAEEGLTKLKEVVPDVIVLDVMMEDHTAGFHFAYKLKDLSPTSELKDYRHIPIIMLTAIGEETGMKFDPKKDGDYLPVEAFLDKPVDPDKLLNKIKEMLNK